MTEAEQLNVVSESAPGTADMPDYLLEPNAVLLDQCRWRHGQAPDYTKANANFEKGKTVAHKAGSLEDIVSNLVKNWEKEVSYKTHEEDFRTIDVQNYRFSVNGGVKRSLSEMLVIGTYSALIGDQALFCSSKLTFEDSHETFKRSMPDGFSWEVVEVLSGLNDKFQIQDLEVYFDQTEPMNSMVKVNGSPMGLPAKGKTPGGVDMEMKPITAPVSPERVKAITRTDSHDGYTKETGRTMAAPTLDRRSASDSDEGVGPSGMMSLSGTLSGIWGLLRLRS